MLNYAKLIALSQTASVVAGSTLISVEMTADSSDGGPASQKAVLLRTSRFLAVSAFRY